MSNGVMAVEWRCDDGGFIMPDSTYQNGTEMGIRRKWYAILNHYIAMPFKTFYRFCYFGIAHFSNAS